MLCARPTFRDTHGPSCQERALSHCTSAKGDLREAGMEAYCRIELSLYAWLIHRALHLLSRGASLPVSSIVTHVRDASI